MSCTDRGDSCRDPYCIDDDGSSPVSDGWTTASVCGPGMCVLVDSVVGIA